MSTPRTVAKELAERAKVLPYWKVLSGKPDDPFLYNILSPSHRSVFLEREPADDDYGRQWVRALNRLGFETDEVAYNIRNKVLSGRDQTLGDQVQVRMFSDRSEVKAEEAKHAAAIQRAIGAPKVEEFDLDWLLGSHAFPDDRRGLLTPAVADKLAGLNVHNRKPDKKKINEFTRKMLQGLWRYTHQAMAIDWDRVWQDGQNRIFAVLESGVTIDCHIFVGMDPDNYPSIDSGRNRTGKEVLDQFREANAAWLSSAIKMALNYEMWGEKTHLKWRTFTVSNEELEVGRARYGDVMRYGTTVAGRVRSLLRVSVGAVAASYYLIRQVAPAEQVDNFFEVFAKGGAEPNDPVARLRNHFIGRVNRGERNYDAYIQMALIIKAWNQTANPSLQRRSVGFDSMRESFPSPVKVVL